MESEMGQAERAKRFQNPTRCWFLCLIANWVIAKIANAINVDDMDTRLLTIDCNRPLHFVRYSHFCISESTKVPHV